MTNWVIVFVRTGSEKKLVGKLKNILNREEYLPFFPVKEAPYRSKGVVTKINKSLFPGYVFIETKIEPKLIAKNLRPVLLENNCNKDIIKLLHYGSNINDVIVRDEERMQWGKLLDSDHRVSGSVGYIIGDMIHVISGALVGMEGEIKYVDRHKRLAIIEMTIMGEKRKVNLMLELIEKMK